MQYLFFILTFIGRYFFSFTCFTVYLNLELISEPLKRIDYFDCNMSPNQKSTMYTKCLYAYNETKSSYKNGTIDLHSWTCAYGPSASIPPPTPPSPPPPSSWAGARRTTTTLSSLRTAFRTPARRANTLRTMRREGLRRNTSLSV